MLELSDVHTWHGRQIAAIRGVSLTVREGEIVSLIGANGAGKTTLLKTISGLCPHASGAIRFQGHSLLGVAPHRVAALGVTQVPEGRRIFPRLTVRENLLMGAFARSGSGARDTVEADLHQVWQRFPVLRERQEQLGGTLSGGEQQMLAIGRALMARPRLLMLDEPSMGLAPLVAERILNIIQELNRQGMTILLVEQNARQALLIAHRAYVLEGGRIVLEGTGSALLCNEQVQHAYLGH
ncbi:MAG: ABC transporter ATP-binding protein [Elusimicrobia bacterium]|nr:ABC transporter ATP-binding protein [Elusimicrobiota bacterium]